MRTLAKSKLIIAGLAVALIIAVPEVSSAQHLWSFDDVIGGLESFEPSPHEWHQPGTRPRARQVANVVSVKCVDCEKAQVIVADYGFKDIRAETCSGDTLGFGATRDGKPFFIRIFTSDGEFSEVKRLH